jgi:hypothetical protein
MSENFSIGEIAIYWNPGNQQHGNEVQVAAGLEERNCRNLTPALPDGIYGCYLIREPGSWFLYAVLPEQLRKKKPPALDRECYRVTSWNDGVWRPREVKQTA